MNVLSLFDGKSSGFTACELAGVEVDNYYSAEIDKYAIQVSNAIHPNQTRLGSVTEWRDWDIDWASIDMIFGGFPCQAWSMAGKQLGDKDERGMLFWTMLDIMKHVRKHNPKADFLIENVKMKKEFEEYITHHMTNAVGDVHKILINSALVSAQNRNRYYWTSLPITQPEDKGIILADIIESNPENPTIMSDRFCERNSHILRDDISGKAKNLSAMEYVKNGRQGDYIMHVNSNDRVNAISENSRGYRPHRNDKAKSGISELGRILKREASKSDTITTSHAPKLAVNGDISNLQYRKLTPRECFRLQTVPEHYIDKILDCGVSNSQLYKIAGNGWTDEVIAHILKCMED